MVLALIHRIIDDSILQSILRMDQALEV